LFDSATITSSLAFTPVTLGISVRSPETMIQRPDSGRVNSNEFDRVAFDVDIEWFVGQVNCSVCA
jgi:hypothetical protein